MNQSYYDRKNQRLSNEPHKPLGNNQGHSGNFIAGVTTPKYNYSAIRFFKENKEVNSDLFKTEAELIAKDWSGSSSDGIKKSQLRKFFDEVKFLQMQIRTEEDFLKYKANMYMINAKVAYTVARLKENLSKKDSYKSEYYDRFKKFITECISKIESLRDFEVFVDLFECVYGYYYELAPSEK